MPPKSWHFILIDGSSNNEDNQRTVRQNAMRDYRRSERLARVRKHMEVQAEERQRRAGTSERLGYEGDQKDFAQEYFHLSRETIRAPRQEFGFIDPFSSTMLLRRRDAWLLFSHFVHEIAPKLQPVGSHTARNSINSFFARSALIDPGLLSAILFHAGVYSDTLNGQPWNKSTLYYYGETVRVLNERLQSSEDSISDSSVAMVAFLAASGNITGNVAADQVHTHALQTMISMRGGLNGLGWKGALAMLISVDLIGATILDCEPRLEAPDLTSNPLTSRLSIDLSQRPMKIGEEKSFVDELVRCMYAMTCLASLQTELLSNPGLSMTSVMLLTQLLSAVQHRLLRCRTPLPLQTSAVLMLYEASRLAQLVCISCISRNFSASSSTLRSLSLRLRQTLISLEPLVQNVTKLSEKRMLAWIVCVGGIASLDQEWYASRLAQIMSELQIRSDEEWQVLLSDFVWSPRMSNRSYDSLLGLVHRS